MTKQFPENYSKDCWNNVSEKAEIHSVDPRFVRLLEVGLSLI